MIESFPILRSPPRALLDYALIAPESRTREIKRDLGGSPARFESRGLAANRRR